MRGLGQGSPQTSRTKNSLQKGTCSVPLKGLIITHNKICNPICTVIVFSKYVRNSKIEMRNAMHASGSPVFTASRIVNLRLEQLK